MLFAAVLVSLLVSLSSASQSVSLPALPVVICITCQYCNFTNDTTATCNEHTTDNQKRLSLNRHPTRRHSTYEHTGNINAMSATQTFQPSTQPCMSEPFNDNNRTLPAPSGSTEQRREPIFQPPSLPAPRRPGVMHHYVGDTDEVEGSEFGLLFPDVVSAQSQSVLHADPWAAAAANLPSSPAHECNSGIPNLWGNYQPTGANSSQPQPQHQPNHSAAQNSHASAAHNSHAQHHACSSHKQVNASSNVTIAEQRNQHQFTWNRPGAPSTPPGNPVYSHDASEADGNSMHEFGGHMHAQPPYVSSVLPDYVDVTHFRSPSVQGSVTQFNRESQQMPAPAYPRAAHHCGGVSMQSQGPAQRSLIGDSGIAFSSFLPRLKRTFSSFPTACPCITESKSLHLSLIFCQTG